MGVPERTRCLLFDDTIIESPATFEWKFVDDMLLENPIPSQRLSTGLPALDRALGGGIPIGSLVTLQGSPGAGKTSLAIQIAMRHQQGAAADVYLYLPDEGWRGGCTRVAQNLGLDRDKVAAGDTETMVALGMGLRGKGGAQVRVCDPDADPSTLEAVLENAKMYSRGSDRPAIIIVDSTQTARAEGAEDVDAERLRIGTVMNLLKKATRNWDCIVLNISHLNRASYRNKKQEDNINPLAGGAESATIERQSDVMVHLSGDVKTVVSALCIKNRAGRGDKPEWQMRFDGERAQFAEIDPIDLEAQKAADLAHEKQLELEGRRNEIVDFLRTHTKKAKARGDSEWATKTYIREGMGLSGPVYARLGSDLAALTEAGDLEMREGKRAETYEWRLVCPVEKSVEKPVENSSILPSS